LYCAYLLSHNERETQTYIFLERWTMW